MLARICTLACKVCRAITLEAHLTGKYNFEEELLMSEQQTAVVTKQTDIKEGGLLRSLKDRHVQLVALGSIIGSGYFLATGAVIASTGPATFLSYIVGGIITYIVMVSLGELAVSNPVTGSFITYSSDYISPAWGCGVGWSYWLCWVVYIPSECTAAGIIMSAFIPSVNQYVWAVLLGVIITVINIINVKLFGEIEFWLALCKILAIVGFSILAVLIFFGIIHGSNPAQIIGTKYILDNGGLFPAGGFAVLSTMVILLCNYQGAEIVGLSAGEADNPAKTIPAAAIKVTLKIILLYVVPVFLLVLILPWGDAGLNNSVFATALDKYGLHWAGGLFSFVALTAALSCSNGGLYGASRSFYALAEEKMAPKYFLKLNKGNVPARATILTVISVWLVLLGSYFFSASTVFISLTSISGFAATICWISIIWSQVNFRKRAEKLDNVNLLYKAPGYPILPQIGIWLQVAALIFTLFNPATRIAFYAGVPAFVLPLGIYWLYTHIGNNDVAAQNAPAE